MRPASPLDPPAFRPGLRAEGDDAANVRQALGEYATIQAAVDAARPAELIRIAPGSTARVPIPDRSRWARPAE